MMNCGKSLAIANGNHTLKTRKPTFLGIGAARSATTWLHSILKSHPNIYMPPEKEIHYFDRSPQYPSPDITQRENCRWWSRIHGEYLKSNDAKTRCWYSNYLFGQYNDEWYVSLFDDADEGIPCGEMTPAYAMLEVSDIQKIHHINPDLKIFFQMRNPIDRAWSGLLQSLKKNGTELDEMDESDICREMTAKFSTARTDYLTTIDNWTSVFPESQLIIVYFEEIQNHPEKLIRRILSFIGAVGQLDPGKCLYKKLNASRKVELPDSYRNLLNDLYADQITRLYRKLNNPIIENWLIK